MTMQSSVTSDPSRQEVDEESYEEARKCAHRIIKAREKTSFELLKRLQEKGHSLVVSERVVERFIEVGLVDDLRYTEIYIRSAQSANKGWQRILRELRQRGIDTEHLEAPLDEEELERAGFTIARLEVDTHKSREKALRKLVTRGYSYGIAKQAIATKLKGNSSGQTLPSYLRSQDDVCEGSREESSFEISF